jgi:hypothetical protein
VRVFFERVFGALISQIFVQRTGAHCRVAGSIAANLRQSDNYDVAKALSAALEPVIDVCLQIGITSPELESLLRATFVRRAFVRLPRQATTGRDPSDSRVSIATGVHRELVDKYAAGKIASTVLKELQRRGNVELLDGDIVRYRSSTARPRGATEANVARAAKRVKRLGDTLFRSLLDPEHIHLDKETKPINLTQQQLAALIPEIERSANLYLAGVERQFRAWGETGVQDNPKRVGINLFSWQEE